MRIYGAMLLALFALNAANAGQQPAVAPYEVVKDHTEIEVAADGTDISSRELVLKALDERGIALLHEQRLAIAAAYEDNGVVSAYTLKANGFAARVSGQSHPQYLFPQSRGGRQHCSFDRSSPVQAVV